MSHMSSIQFTKPTINSPTTNSKSNKQHHISSQDKREKLGRYSKPEQFHFMAMLAIILASFALFNCVPVTSAAFVGQGALYREVPVYTPQLSHAPLWTPEEEPSSSDADSAIVSRSGGNVLRKRQFASLFLDRHDLDSLPTRREFSDSYEQAAEKRGWRTVLDDRYYYKRS